MKLLIVFLSFISVSWAQPQQKAPFSQKTRAIINAVDVGRFETENDFIEMLNVSCERSRCNTIEKIKIKEAGKHIALCNMAYFKMNDLKNSGVQSFCEQKQPVFACDTLGTSLLRKMCYSANQFSLSDWQKKEKKLHRQPASR